MIILAVRWHLRFGFSYRDLEELDGERGVEADHVSLDRWVQHLTRWWSMPPDLADIR